MDNFPISMNLTKNSANILRCVLYMLTKNIETSSFSTV